MRSDPLQHAHHPRRVATHLARTDVAEIQRLHAARGEFVDQHHRKAGARGDQTDLAFRVDVHVIEALGQLAIGIGIGLRPCLDQRGDARLAFHRTKVHHKLRVTGNTPGGRDEQRIDLRQRQFTFDQHIRQPASDRGNMAAPLLGLACHQFGECLDHRIGMRRAWPPLRQTGSFDIDAALSGVKNAEPIIRSVHHDREVAFLARDGPLDQACIHLMALDACAEHTLHGGGHILRRVTTHHPAGLAASAHRHLRLHHPGPIARSIRDGRIGRQRRLGHGHAILGQQRLAVSLDQQHVSRFRAPGCPGRNRHRKRSCAPSGRAVSPRYPRRSCRSARRDTAATPAPRR